MQNRISITILLLLVCTFPLFSQIDSTKKVKSCPPVLSLGKYSGKLDVSRTEWASFEPKSLLVKENCKDGAVYTILEYHLTLKIKGIPRSYIGGGSELYSYMRDSMKKDGISRIVFDEVKAKDPSGKVHKVPPLIIVIK